MSNPGEIGFFDSILRKHLGTNIKYLRSEFKSGGCINNTLKLTTTTGNYFLKWQTGLPADMFEKEQEGLKMLAGTDTLRIPNALGYGVLDGKDYLLLEHIESSAPIREYWDDFGIGLANMHRAHSHSKYGLSHDNYIGKLPQQNSFHSNWIEFFAKKRLENQLILALSRGLVDNKFANRYRKFYDYLPGLLPVDQPALLHGDLWSGNVIVSEEGKACLIDPAVYFGHREIELAFTKMFGGFERRFYEAYHDVYPLEPGFDDRVEIYNVYPHMVHVNLFGTSYLDGVERVLSRYC